MQIGKHLAALAAVSVLFVMDGTATAQLYEETWDPDPTPNQDTPVGSYGWQQDSAVPGADMLGRIGVFSTGGDLGAILFSFGNQDEVNAFYTDTVISGGAFPSIEPTSFTNGVTLSVDVQPAFNSDATSPLSFWMVQIGGSDWYSSALDLGVGGMNGDPFSNFQLDFDSAAANWNTITLTGGTGAPTPGGVAGSDLVGNITGIGFLTMYPLAGTHHFNDIEIFEAFAPGDVDGNGSADINDFNTIRANFNTVVVNRSDGDLNRDGFVDLLDFGEWKDNANVGSGANFYALLIGVPEPMTFVLLVASLLLGLGGRRGRSTPLGHCKG